MYKQEFLAQLQKGLSGLPQADIAERLNFYSEMIDDRMEEGLSEEEAVAAAGSVPEIVAQITADIPLSKIAKERIRQKWQPKAWEIVLLAVGSPIWLSLGIAAVAVIFSAYISVWSVIVSLWAVFASLVACSLGALVAGSIFACCSQGTAGLAVIAAGLILAGLSIFLFYGCKGASKGLCILTGKFAVWMKRRIMKKENAS